MVRNYIFFFGGKRDYLKQNIFSENILQFSYENESFFLRKPFIFPFVKCYKETNSNKLDLHFRLHTIHRISRYRQ